MSIEEVWRQFLAEAKGQLPKGTFDKNLRGAKPCAFDGEQIMITAPTPSAREWLEIQYAPLVERILIGILGKRISVLFVDPKYSVAPGGDELPPLRESASEVEVHAEDPGASNQSSGPQSQERTDYINDANDHGRTGSNNELAQPGDIVVELVERNPLIPFIQVQKYGILFWQPLIGAVAFAIWITLRTMDKQNDGRGPRHRISVRKLERTLGVNRQTITGVARGSSWQGGAFDVLNAEKIALIDRVGEGRMAIWHAKVLNSLPFLTPSQVAKLDLELQEDHAAFINEFASDLILRLEQLSLPSLIQE